MKHTNKYYLDKYPGIDRLERLLTPTDIHHLELMMDEIKEESAIKFHGWMQNKSYGFSDVGADTAAAYRRMYQKFNQEEQ